MRRTGIAFAVALLASLSPRPAVSQQDPERSREDPEVRDPVSLEELIVSVHRVPVSLAATSASVTVLDGRRLDGAGYATVVEALRTVPGLTVVESGSFGSVASVFMRGGESDYVGVFIDGVQVNEPGGRFDFAHLTLGDVDRIEIVRGPVSTMYGSDAVAGVIQIFTRTGSGAPTGEIEVAGGTYGSWRGSAALRGGGETVSYGFSVTGLRSDGTLDVNNEYENLGFSGRVSLSPDDRTDVRLSAHYADHTYHYPTDGNGAVVDANSFSFGDALTLGLEARRRLAPGLELALTLGARDAESGIEDLADGPADTLGFYEYRSLDDIRRLSADLAAHVEAGAIGRFSAGVEVEDQRLRSVNESDSEFGSSSGASDDSRGNRAYYGQWIGRWGAVAANGSLRVEDNDAFGGLVTYTVGAAYHIDASDTKLRAALGRGIKDPTMFESFATGFAIGNPDLVPEASFSREVGVDQILLDGNLRISATAFDQSFEDLIQYTGTPPTPESPNYFNVAAASARGFETELAARLGPLDVSASYTYVDAEATDPGFDEGEDATFVAGEPLLRRPAHEAAVTAVGRVGDRGSAGLTIRRVGERIDRDFSVFPAPRVELEGYTKVDAHAEVEVSRGLWAGPPIRLIARIENLFDESYVEILGFPARRRTIWLGARASLGR